MENLRKTDKALLEQYHDSENPGSYGGIQRFPKNNGISIKRVKRILGKDLGYTLHKPRRGKFPTLPVKAFNIDEQWAAGLIVVTNISKYNRGYKYLPTVIDVFSKHAWVQPIKNKTGRVVTEAFEKILKQGRTPIQLQTDDGKEFYNTTAQNLMSRYGIHHFSTSGDTKASVVERFNRTLKQRLYRYFTTKSSLNFVSVLPKLVASYNRSYHRSVKMAPDQVTLANSEQVWENFYGKTKKRKIGKLKVGVRVRPGWTEDVFVMRQVNKGTIPTYKVDEWDGNMEGTFYEEDLQKVNVNVNVTKIVKRKGN